MAIHAETGAERWSYSPEINLESFPMPRCRGVTQWTDQRVPPTEHCHRVVIAPLMDARVVGLDAVSGQICPFGDVTELDLSTGVLRPAPAARTEAAAPGNDALGPLIEIVP